jgi:hypothetical protein
VETGKDTKASDIELSWRGSKSFAGKRHDPPHLLNVLLVVRARPGSAEAK